MDCLVGHSELFFLSLNDRSLPTSWLEFVTRCPPRHLLDHTPCVLAWVVALPPPGVWFEPYVDNGPRGASPSSRNG
jgi:hypothetical protein